MGGLEHGSPYHLLHSMLVWALAAGVVLREARLQGQGVAGICLLMACGTAWHGLAVHLHPPLCSAGCDQCMAWLVQQMLQVCRFQCCCSVVRETVVKSSRGACGFSDQRGWTYGLDALSSFVHARLSKPCNAVVLRGPAMVSMLRASACVWACVGVSVGELWWNSLC